MIQPILVTGASGVLGRALVQAFSDAGVEVKQAVRNPAKAIPPVPSVRFDYADPSTFGPALAGAAGLVLMAPSLDPNARTELAPAIAGAKSAGVKHIVFISALGVNHNEQAPLRVVEHLVMDSGIPYTILRPNFFMENFSEGFLAGGIKAQKAIYLAAGDQKTSFISVNDIATVALQAFQKPLANQELDLTGPESLDHAEAAKIISEVSGATVTYFPLSEEQMMAGARALGMTESAVDYLGVLYRAVRGGYMAPVSPTFEQVTGHPPTSFRQFAESVATAWK